MLKSLPTFKLELIPIDDLLVDHTYQRPPDTGKITKIVNEWDEIRFHSLDGSRRNGHVYITEGQQRLEALKLLGYKGTVPVVTRTGLSHQHEASAYLGENDKKVVSRVLQHPALLVENDRTPLAKTAVAVQAVLDKLRMEITTTTGPRKTSAVAELYAIQRAYGSPTLKATLVLIEETWGVESFHMAAIRGVGRVLGTAGPKLDINRLRKKMGTREYLGTEGWLAKAREFEIRTSNRGDSLWRALVFAYNNRLVKAEQI